MERGNNLELDEVYDNSTNTNLTSKPASVTAFSYSGSEQRAGFRTVDENVIDEDEDESSEDEDYDHSEHFYRLAKKQYEDILAADPTNTEIKQKLAALVNAHNYPNKKQRTK